MDRHFADLFRPKLPKQFIGENQKKVAQILIEIIESGEPLRKILFLGPSGVGKTALSEMYIRGLLELDEDESIYDKIIYMNCGDETGIDIVREKIIDKLNRKPIFSKYRVFFLDEIHKLSNAAQNALLTPLEQLSEYNVIIASTTEENKIINTLKSRFSEYELGIPNREEFLKKAGWILKKLEIEITPEVNLIVNSIINRSNGNVREFDSFMEQFVNGSYSFSDTEEPDEKSLIYKMLFKHPDLSDWFKTAQKETNYNSITIGMCRYATKVISNNPRKDVLEKCILTLKIFGYGLSPYTDMQVNFFAKLAEYYNEIIK